MPRWNIAENNLPDNVLKAVLAVGDTAESSAQWQLVHAGNTRRVFCYRPAADGPAWLVKWSRRSTLGQWCRARLGRCSALQEAAATRMAEQKGLPVVAYDLVAMTSARHLPLQSLLVSRYIDGAKTLHESFLEHRHNAGALKPLLARLAQTAAQIHTSHVMHGDFTGINILLDQGGGLRVIDWAGARELETADPSDYYLLDIRKAIRAGLYAGLWAKDILFFLNAYLDLMRVPLRERSLWLDDYFGREVRRRQEKVVQGARTCLQAGRGTDVFRAGGYRVSLGRRKDRQAEKQAVIAALQGCGAGAAALQEHAWSAKAGSRGDSPLMHYWRMARALENNTANTQDGSSGHCAVAFAWKRFPVRKEKLFCRPPAGSAPLAKWLAGASTRREVLTAAGDLLRFLHRLQLGLARFEPATWFAVRNAGGAVELFTLDFQAYEFVSARDLEPPFVWLEILAVFCRQAPGRFQDLAVLLRAYGEGTIDRRLWDRCRALMLAVH
ncbi:MAG: hypothetical protein GY868_10135 [Deltaproteobacteria bacterium]|nr:hypothetical protein [Deltaproteobacteria bacterium]